MADDIRKDPMSKKEAQDYINQEGPYKLQGLDKLPEESNTLKEFLYNFIWKYERKHATLYTGKTRDGAIQTNSGRSRSMTDMARIAKYYFPKSTIVQVRNALMELSDENRIGVGMCYSIRRRIFVQGKSKSYNDCRDEFGWLFNKPMKKDINEHSTSKKPAVEIVGKRATVVSKGRQVPTLRKTTTKRVTSEVKKKM